MYFTSEIERLHFQIFTLSSKILLYLISGILNYLLLAEIKLIKEIDLYYIDHL